MLAAQSEDCGVELSPPHPEDPLLDVRLILQGDDGKPRMALLGRRTLEISLITNPQMQEDLRSRWKMFLALNQAGERLVRALGYTDSIALIPPQILEWYGRHLRAAGWSRHHGAAFTKGDGHG